MITNIDGIPFDADAARHMADILSRETGQKYRLVSFMHGYGVEHDTLSNRSVDISGMAPAIYLRPAIQSQFWNVLFLVIALWVYASMETLMVGMRVDDLRVTLFQMIGKTFPWETTVFILEMMMLGMALLFGWSVFYNLASRSYMIGPNGVETIVGLFNKDERRVEYKHVRGTRVRRGIFQRLLFYGTIEIATSGTDGSEIQFRNIARPKKYKEILKQRTKTES